MRPFPRLLTALVGVLALMFSVGATASTTLPEAAPPEAKTWDGLAFRIEDSSAFVGIAPVYLSVSKLEPVDGNLVGTYSIKVPLKSSKNDQGKIILPLNITVKDLGAKGGVLKGKAISDDEDAEVNTIVCEILPHEDQLIRLAITTEHRTINFKSRYKFVETDDG